MELIEQSVSMQRPRHLKPHCFIAKMAIVRYRTIMNWNAMSPDLCMRVQGSV